MLPMLLLLWHAVPTPVDTSSLRAALETPSAALSRWSDLTDVRPALRAAYDARAWQPLWVVQGRATPAARLVLRELGSARDRGLDPADYDADRLTAETDSLTGRDDERAAKFDVAMSAAVARYALALDRGRVDPRTLHPTLQLKREPFDVAAFVESVSTSSQPGPLFRALEPPFYQYRRLQSVLVTYRILARDSSLQRLPDMPKRLRPGSFYAGAPRLRRLLTLLGDLTGDGARVAEAGDTLYDSTLVVAIRKFQRRQGFAADGVIGDSTRARMTRSFDERIRQIELALERWRWLPRRFEAPPIIVNIPGYRLYAFKGTQDIEAEMLAMDVVVGAAVKHDTPLLAVDMVAVQFAPPWWVPTTIARDEIRPKAMKDKRYLAKEHYELLRNGRVVPPTDETIARIGADVRVRQTPGAGNALGRVKFVMPNPEDIYLHDTPSKGFFARARRDFSHGCIRVSDPEALAAFLLRDRPQWPLDSVRAAMASDSTRWATLPARVPVFLVYQTAVVTEAGEAFFYGDVYGHDRALDRMLRKGYPYRAATAADIRKASRVASAP